MGADAELFAQLVPHHGGRVEISDYNGAPRFLLQKPGIVDLTIMCWPPARSLRIELTGLIPAPGLPRCVVTRRLLPRLGRSHSWRDRYRIDADDLDLVERSWSRTGIDAVMGGAPVQRLECDSTRMSLQLDHGHTFESVDAGLSLVLELADADPYGMNVLRELPHADLVRSPSGYLEARCIGPAPIVVGPSERRDGRVRTCVRSDAPAVVPAANDPLLARSGGYIEQQRDGFRIWWHAIETDHKRLLAAVELVRRATSGPSGGAFR